MLEALLVYLSDPAALFHVTLSAPYTSLFWTPLPLAWQRKFNNKASSFIVVLHHHHRVLFAAIVKPSTLHGRALRVFPSSDRSLTQKPKFDFFSRASNKKVDSGHPCCFSRSHHHQSPPPPPSPHLQAPLLSHLLAVRKVGNKHFCSLHHIYYAPRRQYTCFQYEVY